MQVIMSSFYSPQLYIKKATLYSHNRKARKYFTNYSRNPTKYFYQCTLHIYIYTIIDKDWKHCVLAELPIQGDDE